MMFVIIIIFVLLLDVTFDYILPP